MVIDEFGNVGIVGMNPGHDLEISNGGTFSEIDAGQAQFTTSSSRMYRWSCGWLFRN